MRNIGRADSLRGWLLQLKKELKKQSFSAKKKLSGLMLFSLSFFSVFPALPKIDPATLVSSAASEEKPVENTLATETGVNLDEQCLWQKDVNFFESLEDDKASLLREVPCQEKEKVAAEEAAAQSKDPNLDATIRELAAGYPLEVMAPAIAQFDREVAALIVGIAKKESNWGKRVPRTPDGADCFNYWGYKGAGTRGMAMGHGCFGSPEEAVQAVGKRLTQLVEIRKTSEPKNMTIWKCGSSCATHTPESVRKWVSDVDLYYQKIANN